MVFSLLGPIRPGTWALVRDELIPSYCTLNPYFALMFKTLYRGYNIVPDTSIFITMSSLFRGSSESKKITFRRVCYSSFPSKQKKA